MEVLEIPETQARHPSIRLAPLIDVVFILLVFFMLVVQFKVFQQTTLATIQSTNAPITQSDDNQIVTIKSGGACEFSGVADSCEAIISALGQDAAETVFIAFDEDVPLRRIVRVQELIVQNGWSSSLALPEQGVVN